MTTNEPRNIQVTCPACGAGWMTADEGLDKILRCLKCQCGFRARSMTTDPKLVTEAELAEWDDLETDYGGLQDFCIRLIAALRESRKAEEYWHNQAYLMEGKLAEIRAVVKRGLKYDWSNAEVCLIRYEEYVERLEEVIGE